MKIFKKIFRSKLFYLVLLLGVFLIPIFKFNLQAQELETVDYSNKNLAVSNLEDKKYLGDGIYRLYNSNGINIDYNVYSGVYSVNGTWTHTTGFAAVIPLLNVVDLTLTVSVEIVNGVRPDGVFYRPSGLQEYQIDNFEGILYGVLYTINVDHVRMVNGAVFDNFQYKLQLEKGDTATPYTVPLQPYLWHEKRLSYDDGYDDGYHEGCDVGGIDGYNDGYDDGYHEGYHVGGIDGYEAGKCDGYEAGQIDGQGIGYDIGYQDGESDTHAYYNDNGLFIPKLTPKAHLTFDFGRYDDAYFYLRDFSGQYDVEYFSFQHTRWLDIAFDWAYSIESDFLAINDVYIIKYDSDTTLYKYWFYKYDTDSIYFYNDSGALMKIVERSNFDHFVYEAPELSLEEQDRIDTAYDNGYNKAQREYGIKVNDEYLTAKEYGEIQYNLGVISIRDKAYLDGFYTGMKDSHTYGFDWVRATYWELIEESPILQHLSDETSFTYQLAHTKGFNEARGRYGLWYDGRVWVTAEFIREEGYTEAYNLGFRDATNNIYDDIYDEVYNQGYIAGQKLGMNNKFYTGLEKWLVPALIVVLFFGLLMLFPRSKED